MPAKVLSIFFLLSLLVGCQTTKYQPVSASLYLHDELFPEHHSVPIETMDEVFAINEEMKNFVDKHVKVRETQKEQIKMLAEGIFEHSDISLLYQNNANTIATETFANRAANCLSLTIMTHALAAYAGFGVDFQQVDIPELGYVETAPAC